MSDTPRTDAYYSVYLTGGRSEYVMSLDGDIDFARTLERELAEAKENMVASQEARRAYAAERDALRTYAEESRKALQDAKDYLDKHIYGDPDYPWPANPSLQDDLDRAYGVIIAALAAAPEPPASERNAIGGQPVGGINRSGGFCSCVAKCGDVPGWEDKICCQPRGLLRPEPPQDGHA